MKGARAFAFALGMVGAAAAGSGLAASAQPKPPAPAGSDLPSVVAPPGPFKPAPEEVQSDAWIFSGALQDSHEAFSGTLVATSGSADFELKLANGATCDGSALSSQAGLMQMSEISCTDDRSMRVLFVPENGRDLKVFGQVGDERFLADAHLLGTEPPREAEHNTAPPTLQSQPGGLLPPR